MNKVFFYGQVPTAYIISKTLGVPTQSKSTCWIYIILIFLSLAAPVITGPESQEKITMHWRLYFMNQLIFVMAKIAVPLLTD